MPKREKRSFIPLTSDSKVWEPLLGSISDAPSRKLAVISETEGINKSLTTNRIHMTIQPKVRLNTKNCSMLSTILIYEILSSGRLYFSEYLTLYLLEDTFIRLTKGDLRMLPNKHFKGYYLLRLFMAILKETDEFFDISEPLEFDKIESIKLKEALQVKKLLPNQKTIGSWKQYWRPERFFGVKIVRVETIIEEREINTQPYDSYTQGYPTGTPPSTQTTPYSSELDGEEYEKVYPWWDEVNFEYFRLIEKSFQGENNSSNIKGLGRLLLGN